jgi:2-oxoisovalerate dehydrogenase E2 component (dihydrolipoyl transacylase)
MGVHVVKVPDIGEGIAEVELVEWHVRPGDTVAADQVLADLMTDKATVEVPTPVAGRVLEVRGRAGDRLAVGSELLRIEADGAGGAAQRDVEPAPAVAASTPAAESARVAADTPAGKPAGAVTGASGSAAPAAADLSGRPLASPSVRRHARELGVDLQQVRGTGPDGRVMHDDVVRHASAIAPSPGATAAAPLRGDRYARRSGETAVPVVGLRRQIAARMRDSLRIPHFTYVEEVDVTELEALRAKLNDRYAGERGHLTLLPLLMRAIVLGVRAYPQMNARYDDANDVVTRHAAVHVGIATQTDAGLMVPVVRHAEARDPWSSAAEVARLSAAARAGKASRDELSGSTITITSLGALGGIVSTPVINPPEVAIVAVNRIVERPVIRSGAVVPRKLMNLSSSFDHRVIDGQHAAEFVQALRGCLEYPALLFVD